MEGCWDFEMGNLIFPALQWDCFGHNSLDFEAKIMGLNVLESSFHALQG